MTRCCSARNIINNDTVGMAFVNSIPIRVEEGEKKKEKKGCSQQVVQVVSETNGLCRPAPACTRQWLVPGMQSPVRPRRSFLTVSLHVAIPDISPNSACHPALISVRQGSSMRATQEREQNNDESTVASALLFIVIFLLLFFLQTKPSSSNL